MGKITLVEPPKDGALNILKVGYDASILYQNIKLVVDANDRGTGTGIRRMGLPGGGIEPGETPEQTARREAGEEGGVCLIDSLEYFGCFKKQRGHGVSNKNHIFTGFIEDKPYETNDPEEVSNILTFTIGEILNLGLVGHVHEGTLRILLHYLAGNRSGSLSEKICWREYSF